MSQHVLVTGAGKAVGLGFNLVLRYLEAGDNVVATIRKPCSELDDLKKHFGDKLIILTMDIADSDSVNKAAEEFKTKPFAVKQMRVQAGKFTPKILKSDVRI